MSQRFERGGIKSEHLDDLVQDIASEIASNANNGGLSEQLQFLAMNGYDEDRVWARLLMDRLEEGMSVEVSDPKHADSAHASGFAGRVADVCDDYVTVVDQDNNAWDVAFDEIVSADFSEEAA